MNMKFKKEILKNVFAENFAIYFNNEPHFIYLLFTLLKKLKDPKIINITVLKNFRLNFHLFFENVNLAKFLIMLLNENFEERAEKEKVFLKSKFTEEVFNTDDYKSDQFKNNLKFM